MPTPLIDRRRLLALGGMAFGPLAALIGCGGGGDDADNASPGGTAPGGAAGGANSGGSPGAGTPGTAVGVAERLAALDAVAAEVTTLAAGGLRFDSDALVQRLRAMPAFQRVGVSSRMQNVWARFTDGRALVIPNNLDPLPAPLAANAAPARPRSAARERPAGAATSDDLSALLCDQQYRQLDMFGAIPLLHGPDAEHLCNLTVGAETLRDLRWLAEGRGFLRTPEVRLAGAADSGYDNGIEGLRSIAGDGVFFLNGTAAEFEFDNGATTVAIGTVTPADAAAEARYERELTGNSIVYALRWVGAGDSWVVRPSLAITPDFVRLNRWTFPTRCIGILNLTGGSVIAEWGPALLDAGLRNVFYWRQPVSLARVIAFVDDLMQLLLASNRIFGRQRYGVHWPPRLRTHGVGETIQFLVDAGLAADSGAATGVDWLPAHQAPWYVDTLLPTIDYALIREGTRDLELIGQFGAPRGGDDIAGGPEVRFGTQFGSFQESGRGPLGARALELVRDAADPPLSGPSLPERDWKGDVITLDAQPLGTRGGYVQVRNGGRVSNAVPITYWKIPVHVVHEVDGALRTDCTIELHLRADVSAHRMRPHQTPGEAKRIIALASMFESAAHYTATGELSETVSGVTTTLTWSGGSSSGNTVPGEHPVGCAGLLQWDQRHVSIVITGGTGTCIQREVKRRGEETLSDITGPLPVTAIAVPRPEAPLEFVFDERWVLLPGSQTGVVDTTFVLGRARTRTTTVRWDAVMPECAPLDDFGGV